MVKVKKINYQPYFWPLPATLHWNLFVRGLAAYWVWSWNGDYSSQQKGIRCAVKVYSLALNIWVNLFLFQAQCVRWWLEIGKKKTFHVLILSWHCDREEFLSVHIENYLIQTLIQAKMISTSQLITWDAIMRIHVWRNQWKHEWKNEYMNDWMNA